MNARELIEDAINQIDTFKHPDIDDARSLINQILMAADLGSIGDDKITSIDERRGEVCIDTSYSVRCCAMTGSYTFPSFILDTEDPIKAATKYGVERKIAASTEAIAKLQRSIEYDQQRTQETSVKLTELQRQLTTLN